MFNYNSNLSAYQLTISLDKYSVAVEWLLKSGCDFNAYFSHKSQEVRFIFSVIPQAVVDKLNEKYNPAPVVEPVYCAYFPDAEFHLDSKSPVAPAPTTVYMEEVGEFEVLSIDDPTEDDIISLIFG